MTDKLISVVVTDEAMASAVRGAIQAAVRAAAVSAANKLCYTIKEAEDATGLSKSSIYEDISAGLLTTGTLCGRTVIDAEEFRRWYAARFQPRAKLKVA